MGIIKFLRKKYWEDAIFMGGRPILLSCDGMTKIPDKAYALFTEAELERIYEEKRKFHEQLMQMISAV